MSHLVGLQRGVDPEVAYRLLQERLDRNVTGAPESPTFRKILRLLFTPDEARVARHISQFISIDALAERTGVDRDELDGMITAMAGKGLVLDLEQNGRRYASLAPVVIGFYEFTFMRTRDDAPMETLAELFEHYFDEGALPHAVFQMNTQIGRSLVREESLPAELPTEVLDWERATSIVRSAHSVAVSLCPCRHHAQLVGRGCGNPLRTCLSFDGAADALVRAGIAEAITNEDGLEILTECKAAGLAQTADNVQQGVTYMCNCCGCCCGMMRSIKRFGIPNGIVSSNWLAVVDHAVCRGCGKCVAACPVEAIHLEPTEGKGLRRNWAIIDAEKCLGCGVCYQVCRWGARSMEPRPNRSFTPETTFDRIVAMAIERRKLGDLLLDQTDGWTAHALARVLHIFEQTPLATALVGIEPLRSTFLRTMVAGMRRKAASGIG
jgi:NAD-dependent dihydropyrimidine dehydrogenase PreA subunit